MPVSACQCASNLPRLKQFYSQPPLGRGLLAPWPSRLNTPTSNLLSRLAPLHACALGSRACPTTTARRRSAMMPCTGYSHFARTTCDKAPGPPPYRPGKGRVQNTRRLVDRALWALWAVPRGSMGCPRAEAGCTGAAACAVCCLPHSHLPPDRLHSYRTLPLRCNLSKAATAGGCVRGGGGGGGGQRCEHSYCMAW